MKGQSLHGMAVGRIQHPQLLIESLYLDTRKTPYTIRTTLTLSTHYHWH